MIIPNARAKLLAVVDIVWCSCGGTATVELVGTVERRNAIGSIKTKFDPAGTRTEERDISLFRIAHCIDCGAKSLRALVLAFRRSNWLSAKLNSSDCSSVSPSSEASSS